jgi:iron complex transport system substrate-binding protein
VVGTGDNTVRLNPYLGFGSLPEVGSGDVLNVEAIVALRPDAVFAHTGRARFLEGKLGGAGIRVVRMDNFYPDSEDRELELLGRILRREGRARAFLEWKRAVRELHSGRVGPVPPQDRKGVAALSMGFLMSRGGFRVFPSAAAGGGKGSGEGYSTILAGGLDACPELALPLNAEGTAVGVSGEYLLLRDPEFVTLHGSFLGGHGAVDDREIRRAFAAVRENPTLRRTRAGRDGNVYFFHTDLLGASKREPGVLRLASVLYPELFRDVDPEAPLREYFEKWLERPYRGVWFYGERVGRGGRE